MQRDKKGALHIGRFVIIGLAVALAVAGCSRRREASVGTPKNPLVVLLSPSHAPTSQEPLLRIEQHLRSQTGMAVVVWVASSPVEAIVQFGTDAADVGILTTDEYLIAREEYGVRAELQVVRRETATEYDGALLVRSKDGIGDVHALAGKKVAFVDPYSASGFLLPAIFLHKFGVKVEPIFTGSPEKAVRMLLNGSVEAAATYAQMASRHPGLSILARTGTIPNEPVVSRRRLLAEKRQAIIGALQTLGVTPEGKRALGAVADITGFRPASEGVYRPIDKLIRSAHKSIYDLLPEGWEIHKLNQPDLPD